MKITIAVGGKWCAFEQAEQLARLGLLQRIITSYPRSRVGSCALERDQIVSLPLPELLLWCMRRMPSLMRSTGIGEYWKATLFDRMVASRLDGCDLFIGWAAFAKESVRVARSQGTIACIERGSAHILTQKELLFDEYDRWGLNRPCFHSGLVERQLAEYEETDFIIVQSSFAHKSFVDRGIVPEKLLKILLGVDTRLFKPHPKRDNKFRILFVGAITVRKGVPHLLEALRRLRLVNSELVFVGAPDPEIQPLLRRCEVAYRLIGHVPHESLPWWYSQASVFVAPSVEDGFGQVVLEAMSCGVPVIASTHSCGPDVIQEGVDGYLVPPGDAQAIADQLACLYEHRDRLWEMRGAARRRAEQYSWERYGERAMDTFQRVLDSGVN